MIIIPSISRKDTVVRSAKSAIDYVLSARDHAGNLREVQPKILIGEPSLIRKLDNHMAHNGKNKCVSGVIALRDSERVEGLEKTKFLERFLELNYGKMQDKLNICIVEHNDKSNQEFHFISNNIDLEKNKRFNPYPVTRIRYNGKQKLAWQLANEASTRILNYEFGFEQVSAKNNSQFDKSKDIKLAKYSENYKRKLDKKEAINSVIIDDIKNGIIKDRQSLISTIKQYGLKVSRIGEDYITVESNGKKIRFKGGIYSKDSAEDYKNIQQEQSTKQDIKSSTNYSYEQYQHDLKTVEIWHSLVCKTNDKSLLYEFTKHVNNSPIIEEIKEDKSNPYKNSRLEKEKTVANVSQKQENKDVSFNPKALANASGSTGGGGSGSLEGQVTSLISQLKEAENLFGVNSQQAISLRVQLAQAIEALEKSKQAERSRLQI